MALWSPSAEALPLLEQAWTRLRNEVSSKESYLEGMATRHVPGRALYEGWTHDTLLQLQERAAQAETFWLPPVAGDFTWAQVEAAVLGVLDDLPRGSRRYKFQVSLPAAALKSTDSLSVRTSRKRAMFTFSASVHSVESDEVRVTGADGVVLGRRFLAAPGSLSAPQAEVYSTLRSDGTAPGEAFELAALLSS